MGYFLSLYDAELINQAYDGPWAQILADPPTVLIRNSPFTPISLLYLLELPQTALFFNI